MPNNLQHVDFQGKADVTAWVEKFTHDNTDAYALSMAVLVAAYLGDVPLYERARDKMHIAMDNNHDLPAWGKVNDSYDCMKTWLDGRMRVAAKIIDDKIAAQQKDYQLQIDLTKQKEVSDPDGLAYVTWGWSYNALILEGVASQNTNQHAVTGTEQLTGSKQSWGWVMVAQAASHANDAVRFDQAMRGLGIDDQGNGIQALYDAFPPSDYRAWAFAALCIAARDMGKNTLFAQLEPFTRQAIAHAATPKADKMLATVYHALASVEPTQQKRLSNSNS